MARLEQVATACVQEVQLPARRSRRYDAARPKRQLLEARAWRQPLSRLRSSSTAACKRAFPLDKQFLSRRGRCQLPQARAWRQPCLAFTRMGSPVPWLVQPYTSSSRESVPMAKSRVS